MAKKSKHNYTDELELKSLLIRIKNTHIHDNTVNTSQTIVHNDKETVLANAKISELIKEYVICKNLKSNEKDEDGFSINRKNQLNLKSKVIELSEKTLIDRKSYERFGHVILLMIKNILTSSNYNGYTWKDDFTSLANYNILKYLDNFDHKLISSISGQPVNAFAYLTQIITNAFKFVINAKNREINFIQEQVQYERIRRGLPITECFVESYENDNVPAKEEKTELLISQNQEYIDELINTHKDSLKKSNFILNIKHTKINDIDLLYYIHKIKKNNKNINFKVITQKEFDSINDNI